MGRPTEEDIIYTAGLFDGEGSIYIGVEQVGGKRKSPAHRLEAKITNGDLRVLQWLKSLFGGYVMPHHNFARAVETQAQTWNWRVSCNEAGAFLLLILPWLRIKQEQAQAGVEFDQLPKKHGTKLTTEQIAERDWYKQRVSSLAQRNQGGVS